MNKHAANYIKNVIDLSDQSFKDLRKELGVTPTQFIKILDGEYPMSEEFYSKFCALTNLDRDFFQKILDTEPEIEEDDKPSPINSLGEMIIKGMSYRITLHDNPSTLPKHPNPNATPMGYSDYSDRNIMIVIRLFHIKGKYSLDMKELRNVFLHELSHAVYHEYESLIENFKAYDMEEAMAEYGALVAGYTDRYLIRFEEAAEDVFQKMKAEGRFTDNGL